MEDSGFGRQGLVGQLLLCYWLDKLKINSMHEEKIKHQMIDDV